MMHHLPMGVFFVAGVVAAALASMETRPIDTAVQATQQSVETPQVHVQSLTTDLSKLTATPTTSTSPSSPQGTPASASLTAWEKAMVQRGRAVCTGSQADTYYDSARVYYQIADYTKDTSWNACAKNGVTTYRDGYLVPNKFGAAGWAIFPHGLWLDWQRTQDSASKDAIVQLSQHASFADAPLEWTASADVSREVAYNVMTKLIAVSLGATVVHLNEQVAQAFDHVKQWTNILKNQPSGTKATYVRPFMAALTTEALIQWAGDDAGKQRQVLTAIQPLWDAIWTVCWLTDPQTLAYTDKVASDGSGGRDPAPDLNLLIAPAYAWLFKQTGTVAYRDKADALFAGGTKAYLGDGKHFNQNYRWSFKYIEWRKG